MRKGSLINYLRSRVCHHVLGACAFTNGINQKGQFRCAGQSSGAGEVKHKEVIVGNCAMVSCGCKSHPGKGWSAPGNGSWAVNGDIDC